MSKLTFKQDRETEKVWLDDHEIGGSVQSLTIKATPGHPPQIELDLLVIEVETEVPGQENEIRVPQATTDLLVRFGWTPPAGHVAAKMYTTEELLAEQEI